MRQVYRHAPPRPVCGGILAPVLLLIPAVLALAVVIRLAVG